MMAMSSYVSQPEINRLDEGERQAIYLALELRLPLLIEETIGRRIAENSGISISGIAGQIMKAYRQKLISAADARAKLGQLFHAGCINRKIHEDLIATLSMN
jgi:predicted nucleic acid-binding protein